MFSIPIFFDFWCIWELAKHQKCDFRISAVHIFIVFAHRVCNHVFFDLGFDFSSIFAPKSLRNSIKKSIKKICFFQSAFHDFGADLGPHLGAMLVHLGAMLAVLAPLGAPLGDLGRHLGSKMPPRCQMEPPRPPQTSIFINFRTFFQQKKTQHFHWFKLQVESEARLHFLARWRLCARSALDIL